MELTRKIGRPIKIPLLYVRDIYDHNLTSNTHYLLIMSSFKHFLITGLAALVLSITVLSSQAQVISLQFPPSGFGAPTRLAPGESAGLVPAINWNLAPTTGNPGAGTLTNLLDSTGIATTIDLDYTSGQSVIVRSGSGTATPNQTLYAGTLRSGQGPAPVIPVTFSFSEINIAPAYDLILYLSSPGASGTISLNGETPIPISPTAPNSDDPYVFTEITSGNPVGNYIVFRNLTDPSPEIELFANGPFSNIGVAGLQIVVVPEPQTATLMLIGSLFGLPLYRRLQKKRNKAA
ncbi:MAG: hypothetical protein AAGK14_05525 [Verrucomicrobiota bacterium]